MRIMMCTHSSVIGDGAGDDKHQEEGDDDFGYKRLGIGSNRHGSKISLWCYIKH